MWKQTAALASIADPFDPVHEVYILLILLCIQFFEAAKQHNEKCSGRKDARKEETAKVKQLSLDKRTCKVLGRSITRRFVHRFQDSSCRREGVTGSAEDEERFPEQIICDGAFKCNTVRSCNDR